MKTNTPLLDYISAQSDGTQEYPLLKHLDENHPEFFEELGNKPSLFKKHFFLFHQLYLIKLELLENNQTLIISPLEIRLCQSSDAGKEMGETDALSGFYLNKKNLDLTEEEILQMQKKFWEKYLALDKKAEAIKILGLETYSELDQKTLKTRYSELAQKHHPDKGGDPTDFILIKQAYKDLKLLV